MVMIKKIPIHQYAEEVYAIQRSAYQVEADLIGCQDLPPLKETVSDVQQCGETFFGCFINSELCGVVSFKQEDLILDIHRLIVSPEHFRKGIASKLLAHIEREQSWKKIKVATAHKNYPAITFYKRNGFQLVSEEKIHEELSLVLLVKEEKSAIRADHSHERLLTGGNVSEVYRNGNTVRRTIKENSSRLHTLLNHLELKGFDYAPKFLGIDEKGREILSYFEGEAGNYPLKKYMWSEKSLIDIAKMLRRYHDAVSDFSFDEKWQALDHTPEPLEIICHNDFAIYNIIFQNEKPVGVIDFDVAAPGPKLWDIAYTLYTCIPLSRFYLDESGKKVHYQSSKHCNEVKRKLITFFESYNTKFESGILDMVVLRLEGLCETIRRKANDGDAAFKKMIDEGHLEHYEEDILFIKENGASWL